MPQRAVLPPEGSPAQAVLTRLAELKAKDADAVGSRIWSLVYYHSPELHAFLQAVYGQFIAENALNPMAFPSLRRMEQEAVGMVAELLHCPAEGGGTMTSGGTESLFLVLKAARDYSQAHRPYLAQPEVIAPLSAHPAIDKAAHYLGLKVIHTPLRPDGSADVSAMAAAISEKTILLVASAPSYPHGVLDPVAEIAALAKAHGLWCHVDACVGGMILPFLEEIGVSLPPYDFRVEGVLSMSVDLHKYGYAPKGASVLLYRDRSLRRYQFFVYADWPGGIYPSATFLGTRSGGAIAAAWAVLQHLGRKGYVEAAQLAYATAQKIRQAVSEIPELYVVGAPLATILAIGAHAPIDIYAVGDRLAERGWFLDRQQLPASLHLTVSRGHVRVVDAFIEDLKAAVAAERQRRTKSWLDRASHKAIRTGLRVLPPGWVRTMARLVSRTASLDQPPKRTAALYGMMGSLPSKGQVETLALDFLERALDA